MEAFFAVARRFLVCDPVRAIFERSARMRRRARFRPRRQKPQSLIGWLLHYSRTGFAKFDTQDLERLRNAVIRLLAYYEARAKRLQKRFMKIIATMEADAGRDLLNLILAEPARQQA